MKKTKFILILILTLILEAIVICFTFGMSVLDKYKESKITSELIKESYLDLLKHPINNITLIASGNKPILLLGTVGAILLSIFVVHTLGKKQDYKIESTYAVHGSSRFANSNEAFVKGETLGVSIRQMQIDLEKSMRIGSDE